MSGKSIQLPFGVVRDKSKEKSIKLTSHRITGRVFYLISFPILVSHLENPAIKDVIRDGIMDNLSLQQYLLATALLKIACRIVWI